MELYRFNKERPRQLCFKKVDDFKGFESIKDCEERIGKVFQKLGNPKFLLDIKNYICDEFGKDSLNVKRHLKDYKDFCISKSIQMDEVWDDENIDDFLRSGVLTGARSYFKDSLLKTVRENLKIEFISIMSKTTRVNIKSNTNTSVLNIVDCVIDCGFSSLPHIDQKLDVEFHAKCRIGFFKEFIRECFGFCQISKTFLLNGVIEHLKFSKIEIHNTRFKSIRSIISKFVDYYYDIGDVRGLDFPSDFNKNIVDEKWDYFINNIGVNLIKNSNDNTAKKDVESFLKDSKRIQNFRIFQKSIIKSNKFKEVKKCDVFNFLNNMHSHELKAIVCLDVFTDLDSSNFNDIPKECYKEDTIKPFTKTYYLSGLTFLTMKVFKFYEEVEGSNLFNKDTVDFYIKKKKEYGFKSMKKEYLQKHLKEFFKYE